MNKDVKNIIDLLGGGKNILNNRMSTIDYSDNSLSLAIKGGKSNSNLLIIRDMNPDSYDLQFLLLHRSGNFVRKHDIVNIKSEKLKDTINEITGFNL